MSNFNENMNKMKRDKCPSALTSWRSTVTLTGGVSMMSGAGWGVEGRRGAEEVQTVLQKIIWFVCEGKNGNGIVDQEVMGDSGR